MYNVHVQCTCMHTCTCTRTLYMYVYVYVCVCLLLYRANFLHQIFEALIFFEAGVLFALGGCTMCVCVCCHVTQDF